MRYRSFGRSGLRVSEIALGAQRFDAPNGSGPDRAESRAIFDAYAEAGGNFIDTAHAYNRGCSERMLADFIATDRDHFILSSKYGMAGAGEDLVFGGGSRKAMAASVDDSLRRLRTDRLDVLHIHRWDFATAVDEVMRGLDDLVRQGKLLYAAFSNTPAWIAARAATLAELRGWAPLAALQIPYNLLDRSAEREILPMARDLGLGVAAWAPLAQGALAGGTSPAGSPPSTIVDAVREVAQELGAVPAQVALAWLLKNPILSVVPVIGVDNAAQLRVNLEAADLVLEDVHLERLDAVSRIDLGHPYREFGQDIYVDLLTGFQPDRLAGSRDTRAVR